MATIVERSTERFRCCNCGALVEFTPDDVRTGPPPVVFAKSDYRAGWPWVPCPERFCGAPNLAVGHSVGALVVGR